MSLPLPHVIAGFVVTAVLGLGVGPYMQRAHRSISIRPPPGASEEQRRQWCELTSGNEGGAFIGWLERLIFFAAFLIEGAPLVAGAWLAFKGASKWAAWADAAPKKVDGMDDLDFAIGRRRWASSVLATFLVGTAYNLCAGLLGAAVAGNFAQLSKLIGY